MITALIIAGAVVFTCFVLALCLCKAASRPTPKS